MFEAVRRGRERRGLGVQGVEMGVLVQIWGVASTGSGGNGMTGGGAPAAPGAWIHRWGCGRRLLAARRDPSRRCLGCSGLLGLRPGSPARRGGAGWRPPSWLGVMELVGLLTRRGWQRGGGCRGGDPGFGGSGFGWGVVRASGRGGSWDPTASTGSASAGWGSLAGRCEQVVIEHLREKSYVRPLSDPVTATPMGVVLFLGSVAVVWCFSPLPAGLAPEGNLRSSGSGDEGAFTSSSSLGASSRSWPQPGDQWMAASSPRGLRHLRRVVCGIFAT